MSDLYNKLNLIQAARDDIQTALANQGQTVTSDIRTYANAVMNISGSSLGIKQFDTIENMQLDPTAQEGDLAVVYSSNQSNFTEVSQAQYITFPETVTLPEAVSDYIQVGLKPVDAGVEMDCMGGLHEQGFSMQVYFMDSDNNYRIIYTSSDGLTYTRTTFQDGQGNTLENPVDMQTIVEFGSNWDTLTWYDVIGYFMIVGNTKFDGLFRYSSKDNRYEIAPTGLTANEETVYKGKFYSSKGVAEGNLQNISNLNLQQIRTRANIYDNFSFLNLNTNITNISELFSNSKDLTSTPNIDTSNVVNFTRMFYNCINLKNIPNFDTSKGNNFSGMFYNCGNIITIPNFNINNVSIMNSMFLECSNLIEVPNLNTINVRNMTDCFQKCTNLTSVPNFDTSNLIQANSMFSYCSNLQSVPEFDFSNLRYSFQMFYNCQNLVNVPILNLESIEGNGLMFFNCKNLSSSSIANIVNSLPDARNLSFEHTFNYIMNNSSAYTIGLTTEQQNILANKHYTEYLYKTINYSNISSYWNMRINGSTWYNIRKNNYANTYNIDATGSLIRAWATSYNANNLYVKDSGIESTLYYANCFRFLVNCVSIEMDMNTTHLVDASQMFFRCGKLVNFSNFNSTNVTNMANMCESCISLVSLPNLDTSNVTTMTGAFNNCIKLTTVPNFDLSNVREADLMFYKCSNLTEIPNFALNNLVSATSMFQLCNNLKNVPNLYLPNVASTASMFYGCYNLDTLLDINTPLVENMRGMFGTCYKLNTTPNIYAPNVKSTASMFFRCSNLQNISSFNTHNVEVMSEMFAQCINLVNVPQFNTSNVTDMRWMFGNCNNLSDASIQNIINMVLNSNITDISQMNLNVLNSNSIFTGSNITSDRYSNRLTELTQAGWGY